MQDALDLAVDGAGYPLLAGAFAGRLDLDGREIEAPPPENPGDEPFRPPVSSLFVAKLAPAACAPFALEFAPISYVGQVFVTTGVGNDVFYAAVYRGTVDFGGGPITDAALVKLSASGEHRWSKELTAGAIMLGRPVVDEAGGVFVAGLFRGSLSLGGAQIGAATPDRADAFVAKLDPAGTIVWSKILALASLDIGYSTLNLAAWPSGQVAVSGVFATGGQIGTVDVGGGPEPVAAHEQIGFVTSFDAAGTHLWDQRLTNDGWDLFWPTDSAVDAIGRLKILQSNWGEDTRFLVRGPNGEIIPDGETTPSEGYTVRMSIDPKGETLLGGQFSTSLSNGPPKGDDAVVVSKLDAKGKLAWSRAFTGPPSSSRYWAVSAFGPSGSVWVAGSFSGGLDFGQGALTSEGDADIFLAQLPP